MKTKTLVKPIAIAALLTTSFTACKKSSPEDRLTDWEKKAIKQDTEDITLAKRIAAFRYWKAVSITTDEPVDLYKKGATKDLFAQRPPHQADYILEVEYARIGKQPQLNYTITFGQKHIEYQEEKIKKDEYLLNEEDKKPKKEKKDSFQFTAIHGTTGKRLFTFIQPYQEPEYDYGTSNYSIESFEGNVLKVSHFDYYPLKATVHITFVGSNEKPVLQ